MKKLIHIIPLLVLTACKSISTKSNTEFYDANGVKIAEHVERTASRGLFVKSESVKVQATITYTNEAPGFVVGETKVFGADKISSEAQADAIKAAGSAVGNNVGEAGKAFIKP